MRELTWMLSSRYQVVGCERNAWWVKMLTQGESLQNNNKKFWFIPKCHHFLCCLFVCFFFVFVFKPGSWPGYPTVLHLEDKGFQGGQGTLWDHLHWPHAGHRVECNWGLADSPHQALWEPLTLPKRFITTVWHTGPGFKLTWLAITEVQRDLIRTLAKYHPKIKQIMANNINGEITLLGKTNKGHRETLLIGLIWQCCG